MTFDSPMSNDLNNALCKAVNAGDLQTCNALLNQGADVHYVGAGGLRPLHLAARKGHAQICRILLNRGAEIECKCLEDRTALIWSVIGGTPETTRVLLEHGADVHSVDATEWQALYWAASAGDSDTVLMLVQNGADMERGAPQGESPLQATASVGHVKAFALLLALGAQVEGTMSNYPEIQLVSSMPRLHAAAYGGHTTTAIRLLEDGFGPGELYNGFDAISVAMKQGHEDTAHAMRSWIAKQAVDQSVNEILKKAEL